LLGILPCLPKVPKQLEIVGCRLSTDSFHSVSHRFTPFHTVSLAGLREVSVKWNETIVRPFCPRRDEIDHFFLADYAATGEGSDRANDFPSRTNHSKGNTMRMRICWNIVLSCLVLALSACSTKPTEAPSAPAVPTQPQAKGPRAARPLKEEIIGKWQRTDAGKDKEVLVVDKNGDIRKGEPGYELSGKYKFLDDNTLEFTAQREGTTAEQYTKWMVEAQPEKLTVKVVEAKSRPDDIGEFSEKPDDTLRKGIEEHYKRIE
jgi:hypothetical protein